MKKLYLILLIFGTISVSAQENLAPVISLENDTAQIDSLIEFRTGIRLSPILMTRWNLAKIETPKFNFLYENDIKYNFAKDNFNTAINFNSSDYQFSPFYHNTDVFNFASYQLNSKLKIGGYSFGANSILSAPLPNMKNNNYEIQGNTMFMQYKISKNFKIETRVSVTQQNFPKF